MKTRILILLLLVILLPFLTSSIGVLKNLRNNFLGCPEDNGPALASIVPPPEIITKAVEKDTSDKIYNFINSNKAAFGGVVALFVLWFFLRLYYILRRPVSGNFTNEELALLKMAKDNMNRIWENHRPGKNVVRLEEWRE